MKFTMSKIFLDSNILIYLYTSTEPQKNEVIQKIVSEYDDICISTQVLFEFSSVTRRKYKFDYANIEKALEEFKLAFDVVTISYEMIRNALKCAEKYEYSFPDSLIIVTALAYDCDILLSEDMHHGHILEKRMKIINPFK